jgi:hypothetical protein
MVCLLRPRAPIQFNIDRNIEMKKLIIFVLLAFGLFFSVVFIFDQLLIRGSEKIPAYMMSFPEAMKVHPEITQDQRKDAEIFFRGSPLLSSGASINLLMIKMSRVS